MSKRNNWENKQSARERLRAEREQQAKKERTRRQLLVGGAVVGVLALAAGIGVAVSQLGGDGKDSAWEAAAKKTLVKPANTAGDKGTEIVIGDKNAKHTLEIYQDMRCPVCSVFEQNVGDTIDKDVKAGTFKVRYHIGAFLDRGLGGTGAKNALSAVGAALDVSPEAFSAYNKALYSKANHPVETKDAFANDDTLLKIAQQVPALKGNAKFEKNVKDGTFDKWALEMSDEFDSHKDVTGTPTIKLDGEKLTVDTPQGKGAPMTAEQFRQAVDARLK
ncbi:MULTISPECIES: thioredoxin domain-containing protein [Streptomyces]|uniref:thioredoxin domain-containing protein n=1 Tax=Streptomyces TaxID=1883 RepID=UPI00163CB735|nr:MULTISPECIES: thioredoxin domain-containing protein [Streptomyces]MBC2877088.1 DsbA family protein [Streptomyces sp. TYQ1024]UBI39362.1 DsbA family protein [Streptomyces mobaraensis]UKW31942.1 DsbA family protein [Streptomyces sp. TYQ1024]